ncbi:putative chitinase [Emericellopsis cladophorae]|uniref:chitinase n=1 Tax=Emericellopsis cladophorae TaxID=2686198 RepID=A0A9P9XY94_9HYPO|nr:putative chitinase [Emericellopsis cladophorae]KAI6779851.1 putative chitinase [Emericellopsis cladophorae]
MAPAIACHGLCLGMMLVCMAHALKLDTFAGQAEAKLLLEAIVDQPEVQQRKMVVQAHQDEEEDYTCSESKPCKLGCCGPLDDTGAGVCGMGPDFCGDGCTSGCHWKSECDPGWGSEWSNTTTCLLNVCCSEFGFCGTTQGFCGGKTVPNPECPVSAKSASKKLIGYYEGWNHQRPCGNMEPEDIPLGYYTHIFFSFALMDPDTFRMDVMDEGTASRYGRVTALKEKDPELEVWIAVWGWAMNDPGPYRTVFSDMAKGEANQDKWFDSLISMMQNYGFDGVDLDWEYPVAEDRGGIEEDFASYVNLLRRLRERLNQEGRPYGVTLTLGLNLLWRNNINPERVVTGLGFYGRSFTMKDPSCMAAGCEFLEGAGEGECTGTAGVLSAAEISKIIDAGADVTLDETAAVKIVTWDSDQWVSWDDEETLKMKLEYAHQRCLGGTMVWAIDLDDGTLISSLGKASGRAKKQIITPRPWVECFKGDW